MNIASYPTLQKLECILQVLLIGDSGTERSIYTETKTKQKNKDSTGNMLEYKTLCLLSMVYKMRLCSICTYSRIIIYC